MHPWTKVSRTRKSLSYLKPSLLLHAVTTQILCQLRLSHLIVACFSTLRRCCLLCKMRWSWLWIIRYWPWSFLIFALSAAETGATLAFLVFFRVRHISEKTQTFSDCLILPVASLSLSSHSNSNATLKKVRITTEETNLMRTNFPFVLAVITRTFALPRTCAILLDNHWKLIGLFACTLQKIETVTNSLITLHSPCITKLPFLSSSVFTTEHLLLAKYSTPFQKPKLLSMPPRICDKVGPTNSYCQHKLSEWRCTFLTGFLFLCGLFGFLGINWTRPSFWWHVSKYSWFCLGSQAIVDIVGVLYSASKVASQY